MDFDLSKITSVSYNSWIVQKKHRKYFAICNIISFIVDRYLTSYNMSNIYIELAPLIYQMSETQNKQMDVGTHIVMLFLPWTSSHVRHKKLNPSNITQHFEH